MGRATILALASTVSANAQSAAPGAEVMLPPIVVETTPPSKKPEASPQAGSVSSAAVPPMDGPVQEARGEAVARQRLGAIAGGTNVVGSTELEGRADVTLGDTLKMVPGVIVQNFFGGNDQPRIQIRGSGLQQNPVERGVLILQDGLPLNRADGSYVVGLADPRQADFIEIYRGYAANRLGATVLGGAINFTSPTGSSSPGAAVSFEAGSFGQITTTAQAGAREGDLDGSAQISFSERDGFRDYNSSERTNVNLNAGARVSDNISTRIHFGYTDLGFDVAGPLPWTLLKQDPKQVYDGPTVTVTPTGAVISNPGPNVVRDLPRRDTEQFRVGSRTSANYGAHLVDMGLGYAYTDDTFRFPIAGGIRTTEGGDFTSVLRYAYSPDKSARLPLFEATAQYVIGSADRQNYQNIDGSKGARFGDSELDAATLSLYAGLNIPLGGGFTLSPAIAYAYATRDNDDQFGTGPRPVAGFNPVSGTFETFAAISQDTSYAHSYSGWSPSLGLVYEVAPQSEVFAAVSRSFEPPTHDDLLATINGSPFYSPGSPTLAGQRHAFATPDLDAQTAITLEGGWRGRQGLISWEAVTYYSWVDNELLNLRDASGVSLGAVNADDTRHFGIELGLAARLSDRLSARVAYTYQDFHFENDPVHGDNELAGAPPHTINAALRYSITAELFLEAEVNWRPDETPVDNANTLYNEAFVTVDARANYDFDETLSVYGEVRNVFDEKYASSTLIVDQAVDGQAAFLPGDGRAFIVGVRGAY
jgi:iron complex outermembrane receptor protein